MNQRTVSSGPLGVIGILLASFLGTGCVPSPEEVSTSTDAGSVTQSPAVTLIPGIEAYACRPYVRDEWSAGGWADTDGDCQNTRAEVLIETSESAVIYTSASSCYVANGRWYDPYTDGYYEIANQLEIDHRVAVAEAHWSGGWRWDAATRHAFYNDLNNLLPVEAFTNQQKSALDPGQWLPPNMAYWQEYARAWAATKVKWGLTADSRERTKLAELINDPSVVLPALADEVWCSSPVAAGG